MLNTEIKKGKGIEDVLRGITPGRIEDERLVEVVGSNVFGELMENYMMLLEYSYKDQRDVMKMADKLSDHVLKPQQIGAFLQATIKFETYPQNPYCAGLFVSQLIQKSYRAGHNGFTLNTGEFGRQMTLGKDLTGYKESPLKLNIEGGVGCQSGHSNICVDMTVQGYVEYGLAYHAKDSVFTLHGDIWTIKGENDLRFCGNFSTNCTFKTTNEETCRSLVQQVPSQYTRGFQQALTGNRIIFIDADGNEEVVVNYEPDPY